MIVNLIEELHLLDIHSIQILYLTIDIVSKFAINLVIYDYNSYEINFKDNIDLQTFSFISYILENIKKYEKDNTTKTTKCENFIHFIKQKFISIIPQNKDNLKKELLQKILPFNFDTEYIERISLNADSESKQLKMICVLFTDIVNYTELAKRYNDKIIFELLNTIYIHFDKLIKKYAHLQKVETIGDAYMVVGDIYRNAPNHKTVIQEMISLSVDFLNDVPTIKTPDKIPLMLRIGISMGNVSIGILGNEIPRLCVVGNTVNVAARLQSTADANSIQISTHIYEQLGEIDLTEFSFHIQKNENVFLKNIGSVVTYTLSMEDSSNTTEDTDTDADADANINTNINNKFRFPYPFMHGCV
jgi:class 3 adenylate cyclase